MFLKELREKIDVWSGIKEETRNLLAFYKKECGADLNDLPIDILAGDVRFNLDFLPRTFAFTYGGKFYDLITKTYGDVVSGIDPLDITSPKHIKVQTYIKSILKNNDGKNN